LQQGPVPFPRSESTETSRINAEGEASSRLEWIQYMGSNKINEKEVDKKKVVLVHLDTS
jgi:hypothetical protein